MRKEKIGVPDIDDKSMLIELTQGYYAIVDLDDYEELSKHKWHIVDGHHVYAQRNSSPDANGKRSHILMHRVISKPDFGFIVDHINGNGLDNRKLNLRNVTRSENQQNRYANKPNTSKYKGVYWHKQSNRWRASIQHNKKRIHLGNFGDEVAAAETYKNYAIKIFGEYNKENYYD